MAIAGFLLDLDGTLIDSNRTHTLAWVEAMEKHGYRVAEDRIAIEIGKGGDQLVSDVLGAEAEKKAGDAMRKTQQQAFARRADRDGIPVIAGAEALLAALRDRGIRTALATSSSDEGLEVAERASGVVWSVLVDEVVGASDVQASKPAPDIVQAACKKLKLHPAQCALLGDTPWDAKAARAGGVVMAGITSGGRDAMVLRRAGARAVYRDAAEIVDRIDEVLRRLSPATMSLGGDALADLMRHALHAAEEGMMAGEVPIGAVIARGDGTLVSRGYNRYNETGDQSRHAEIDAFSKAAGKLSLGDRDAILVSTLEPCVMCTGGAMELSVDTVVYGLAAPDDSGSMRVTPPESPENQMPRIVGRVLERESRALFESWLSRPKHNDAQEAYVRRLLATT